VTRHDKGVTVKAPDGGQRDFDDVVIAAHADQALAMLTDATPEERRLLSCFRYSDNKAYLHRDAGLMPKRRRLWSSWNYISGLPPHGSDTCSVTYWMNRLQPLTTETDLFVSLNPARKPLPGTLLEEFDYKHPIFDPAAMQAQGDLWTLQGQRRTWFCGAYFGSGFHEDGLQAGLAVAEALGGVRRPWTVEDESGRIHLAPAGAAAAPLRIAAE
jgi:predicted NAD/FAD-binding protein